MGHIAPVLGILCGLADEAQALGAWRDDPRLMVRLSAGRVDRAEMAVAEMVAARVRGIVSWGVCGGLDPELAPGDLVECAPAEVFAAERVLATPMEKADARRAGAKIVDLESAAVAASGLPGVAIRSVLDEAEFSLPEPALVDLRDDGRPDIGRIIGRVLTRPDSLPGMIRLARRHGRAMRSLRRAAGRIGAFLKRLDGVQS